MDEILINTNTTGDQDQPGVAGFRGTQFIVVWADRATQDIKARLLGANGVPSSGEFAVNFPQKPGTKRQLPTVIETRQGFAVAWIEQLPGAKPQLKLRTFDEDTISGPESQVSSAEVEPLIRPAMAPLSDGGFVVVWADLRARPAYPRAALCIRRDEKRHRVSRQHRRRAAPLPDGRRIDQRKFRDRLAGAAARPSSGSLPDLRRERERWVASRRRTST